MKSTLRQFLAELQSYADENPELLDRPLQIRIPDHIEFPDKTLDRIALLAAYDIRESWFSHFHQETTLHLAYDGEET